MLHARCGAPWLYVTTLSRGFPGPVFEPRGEFPQDAFGPTAVGAVEFLSATVVFGVAEFNHCLLEFFLVHECYGGEVSGTGAEARCLRGV